MKNVTPALIISRCSSSSAEFDNISKSLCQPAPGIGGHEVFLRLNDEQSFSSFANADEKIIWLNGRDLTSTDNPLIKAITDKNPGEEELVLFLDQLKAVIAEKWKIGIDGKFIMVIHAPGVKDKPYLDKLEQRLINAFKAINIDLALKLCSSVQQDVKDGSYLLPLEAVGLKKKHEDCAEIRKLLDTLKPYGGKASLPLFEQCLDLEKELKLMDSKPVTEIKAKLEELKAEYREDALNPIFEALHLQVESVAGLTTLPANELNFFAILRQDAEGNKYICFEQTTQASNILFRPIDTLKECAFVYLGLDMLSQSNYNVPYRFTIDENKDPVPCIFITLFDLIHIDSSGRKKYPPKGTIPKSALSEIVDQLDGRFRFFDSSIWFRLISIESKPQEKRELLEKVRFLQQKNIYSIPQALESRDFIIRMFNQSYVGRTGSRPAHMGVTPLIFHSESVMKQKAMAIAQNDFIKKLKWNILLIDDHAKVPFPGSSYTKQQLIEELLSELRLPGNIKITHTIAKAHEAIEYLMKRGGAGNGAWHDVILLDYLLVDEENDESEFGDEIVKTIYDTRGDQPRPDLGPLNKDWLFPVSVYANTLQNKLHEAGISMYSKKFILFPGADPIGTPYLFLCDLLQLLQTQAQEILTFTDKPEGGQDAANPVIDFIQQLTSHDAGVKANAMKIFPEVVSTAALYKHITKWSSSSNGRNSAFAQSVYEEYFNRLESYELDAFRDVVYLLGYGNINDKDKLWGEWFVIKDILNGKLRKRLSEEKVKTAVKNIEEYISKYNESR